MPVKYSCPICGRRFAEWGAEKHGFKCPGDEWCPADRPDGIELVRLGMKDDAKPAKKPTLKRPVKRAAPIISSIDDDELLVPDVEVGEVDSNIDDDDADEVEEDEVAVEVTAGAAAAVVSDDSDEDLDTAVVNSDDLEADDADVDDTLEDAEDIVDEEWKA